MALAWIRKPVSIWCDQKTSQYLVWSPFASCSVTHLLLIELIRLLIVAWCPTPLQWLWEVAGYWRELEHADVHVNPEHPKHAQWVTCLSMQARTGTFSASRNCAQILVTWGLGLLCLKIRWWQRKIVVPMDLKISSWYPWAFKLSSIKCDCVVCSLCLPLP